MYRFNKNDIIYNTVKTYPTTRFVAYSSNLYINNQNEHGVFETGSVYAKALNLSGSKMVIDANSPEVTGNFGGTAKSFKIPIPFSIFREFVYKSGDSYDTTYTDPKTLFKFLSLKNTINQYKSVNPVFNFDTYFNGGVGGETGIPLTPQKGTATKTPAQLGDEEKVSPKTDLNLIYVDPVFIGKGIKPGSADLQYYFNGELVARATDEARDGVLREKTNSTVGVSSSVGFVLYSEGVIVLYNTDNISDQREPYIQPTSSVGAAESSHAKWVHFFSYKQTADHAAAAISASSYILDFKGTQVIPTLTMFAHAPKNELNWSNNPTYISASQGESILVSSSFSYIEQKARTIKNTISSSFARYSASFKPQTFISTIGVYDDDDNLIAITKLANPVRKTDEQDYTFKLKLDL
tara:strand:- start:4949 stop:6172 length:1224 start_codon:yes stop_codon:yes gene_type:complete